MYQESRNMYIREMNHKFYPMYPPLPLAYITTRKILFDFVQSTLNRGDVHYGQAYGSSSMHKYQFFEVSVHPIKLSEGYLLYKI